jgi:hypothetical protein
MPYYLVSGGYTETLAKVRLLSRPGDEFVQAARVESRVRARQGPQGAPACGLALDAEPPHLLSSKVNASMMCRCSTSVWLLKNWRAWL